MHVGTADFRARRGHLLELVVEGQQAELILEEHRRQAHSRHGARDRGLDGGSVRPASRGKRRIGHGHNRGVAVLLELTRDERAEVVERRLRPVDIGGAVAGLPVAGTDEVEPPALVDAGVVAQRQLLHSLQNEDLYLGYLAEIDELGRRGWGDHGTGTDATRSSITISTVTPWLAAWGPSQTRWPST